MDKLKKVEDVLLDALNNIYRAGATGQGVTISSEWFRVMQAVKELKVEEMRDKEQNNG